MSISLKAPHPPAPGRPAGAIASATRPGGGVGSPRVVIEIAPSRGWHAPDLREVWMYRDLLYILVWRDLKVRYRQTVLGAVWVMGQPLLTVVIFTLLFNRLARIEAGGDLPYAVFVLAGILPWTYFATAVQGSGNSLLGSAHLVSKVYFPRLLIPASFVVTALVDLGVSSLLLGGLMAIYRIVPAPTIVLLPLVVLVAMTLALGVGLWLAALNVEYRDVRVLIPFLLQVWMYATPVVYPLRMLPEAWRPLAYLNPATGIVEAFRACLLGTPVSTWAIGSSSAAAVVLLGGGALFFRRMERRFADVI